MSVFIQLRDDCRRAAEQPISPLPFSLRPLQSIHLIFLHSFAKASDSIQEPEPSPPAAASKSTFPSELTDRQQSKETGGDRLREVERDGERQTDRKRVATYKGFKKYKLFLLLYLMNIDVISVIEINSFIKYLTSI